MIYTMETLIKQLLLEEGFKILLLIHLHLEDIREPPEEWADKNTNTMSMIATQVFSQIIPLREIWQILS